MPHPVVVCVFLLRMLSTWQWSRVTSDVCGTVLVGNDSVDVLEGEDGMSTNAESIMRPITRITVKMLGFCPRASAQGERATTNDEAKKKEKMKKNNDKTKKKQ